MRLNDQCHDVYQISTWERWDYNLDSATLTFSQRGMPRVVASIQVVGTTSSDTNTWMWSWANRHLPDHVSVDVEKVREFGEVNEIGELTDSVLEDDEYLGWAMTAVAARVLNAKGGYRCPSEKGFVYVVFTELAFAA